MKLTLLLSLMLVCGTAFCEDGAEARAARYFAAGLDRPLLQLRAGAQLIEACHTRLKRACDQAQRTLAAETRVTDLLDALTLFPQRLPEDPSAGITRAQELRRKIGETSAALLQAAGEFDRRLFARYGATLRVCPRDVSEAGLYRASLSGLMRTNYEGFQGLDAQALASALEATTREEDALVATLRALPEEDCLAAAKIGEHLMELMNSKLAPWRDAPPSSGRAFDFSKPTREKDEKDRWKVGKDRELANAIAGNYVTVVATELQLIVFPHSEARIKQLADAIEASRGQDF
jgi:hypothetical protein